MMSASLKAQPAHSPHWNLDAAGFVALLALAGIVRLWRLNHFSYWLDEILQAYWVHQPWHYLWGSIKADAVHPPLDYLIAWTIELASPADWVRKLPAVLWGTATVGVLGILVARRVGRLAGMITMLLLALAPFHLRYSQELRPYSLGVFSLCLTLLLIDVYLEHPRRKLFIGVFIACLATMYTLYLAAVVLFLALFGFLANEAISGSPYQRQNARRLFKLSPLILAALAVGYLPWWPVVLKAARSPSPVPAEPLSFQRLDRGLAFFAFAQADGELLRWVHAPYLCSIALGVVICLRRPRARPLVLWAILGAAAIEVLEHLHPHWYVTRWFLPAGIALPALAGVGLAWLVETRTRWSGVGIAVLVLVLTLDCQSLAAYFTYGRPDWRVLAKYLKLNGRPDSRVFTESQWPQLCLAFYLDGPQWLFEVTQGRRQFPEVINLEGDTVRLTWAWKPGQVAWLILHGDGAKTASLRAWARQFDQRTFPPAEHSVLVRLDPSRRAVALRPPL